MIASKMVIRLAIITSFTLSLLAISGFVSAYTWNSTLSEELRVYYDFNNSLNLLGGSINLSANEGDMIFNTTDCLIGTCGQTIEGSNFKIRPNALIDYSGVYSMNFWVRGIDNGVSGNPYFLGSDTNHIRQMGWDQPTQIWITEDWTGGNARNLPGGQTGHGVWFMITITRDEFGMTRIYRDGVLRTSGTGGFAFPPQNIVLGNLFNNGLDWHGQFDEFGYWRRKLEPSEIVQLYNAGEGMTYSNNTPATSPLPSNLSFVPLCWTNQTNKFTATQIFASDVTIGGLLSGGRNIFDAYDGKQTGTYDYLTGEGAVISFNVVDRKDSLYDYSRGSDQRIVLLEKGYYTVSYHVCVRTAPASGEEATHLIAALTKNGREIPGTKTFFGTSGHEESNACASGIKDITATMDDQIAVSIGFDENYPAPELLSNIEDASSIHIEWSQ